MDGKMGSFYEFDTLADIFRFDVKKRRLTHNGKEIAPGDRTALVGTRPF
jgi:hypothetical protein